MTDDRDFKRLVRARMAKTGESYTAARAHFRPPSDAIEAFRARAYTRPPADRVGTHLHDRYGIDVRKLTELDIGVFRVDRRDGPAWVARVFPTARALDQVEGDAEILRFLAGQDFPAERCAHTDPVSTVDGHGVLVTEHVAGRNTRGERGGQLLEQLGDLLGRMHSLPADDGAMGRPAGSWHHLSLQGGSRADDVAALGRLLADHRVADDQRELLDVLRQALAGIDDSDGLPPAFTHPDPCGANVMSKGPGHAVYVDWTGAGRGPRVAALASLVGGTLQASPGAPPSRDLRLVDAIVAGYRAHVRLEDAELARLAGAIAAFPLIIEAWSGLFHGAPLREVVGAIAARREHADRVAQRVAEAFDADIDALTGWYTEPSAPRNEHQGTLF
jgi:Ser/Thr protein kinase RdoA (MazF antagonist)